MSLRTMRQYATLPSLPTRGPMPPIVGVIIPLDRTNLVTNPSVELATTGYTAVGGSTARSTAAQYHGTYSLQVIPSAGTNSDGAFYGTVSLTSGTPYAYSLKFRATGTGIGKQYTLAIATTGGVDLHVTPFVATGRWQWIRGVYGETATTTRRVYIRKSNHAAADVFYTDGWQVESCADGILDATTYIDGDQPGLLVNQQPPAYGWNGTPHASTSYRTLLTRAGGYVVNLSTYTFLLTGLIGLGMAVPNNVSVPYTVLDGARYLRTTKPPRTISLPGRFQADEYFAYQQSLSDMRQAFDRDLVPIQQPLVLQIEPQDECGQIIGEFAQARCLYAGGLEGNDSNLPIEDAAPTFAMYVPFLLGGDSGIALSVQGSVTNANAVVKRNPRGEWSALSTGVAGSSADVYALSVLADGRVIVAGDFLSAGASGADFAALYTPSSDTFSNLAGSDISFNNPVFGTALTPAGDVVFVGIFTNVGDANGDNVVRYNVAANTFTSLGTGANGQLFAVAVASNGYIFAGGPQTTDLGGVANTNGIGYWDGAAWQAMGTGLPVGGLIAGILADGDSVYVMGSFANVNGVANTVNLARWSISSATWFSVTSTSGAPNNTVWSGVRAPNGKIYFAGAFTAIGGINANYHAVWNRASFAPVVSATAITSVSELRTQLFDAAGVLHFGATNTGAGLTINGVTYPDVFGKFNGTNYAPEDIDLPGTPTIRAFALAFDGTFYVGFTTTGTATAALTTSQTATNDGPAITYPKLIINGPTSGSSRIFGITNYTTGANTSLSLTMLPGEVVTIDFDPAHPQMFSTFQGDVSSTLLSGSQPIYLAPGANSIAFFAASSTVTATLNWQKRYNGLADLVN